MRKKSLFSSRVVVTLVLLGLMAGCTGAVADGEEGGGPTLLDWVQWQPQTDNTDTRLSAGRVTAAHSRISITELLNSLAVQTGVALSAEESLSSVPATVFVDGCALDAIMVRLAHLVGAYWVYPGAAPAAEREYRLAPFGSTAQPIDVWSAQHVRDAIRAAAGVSRPEREARLALYQRALSLSAPELLEEYEELDPWLCADLLDPVARPMLEYLLALPQTDRDQLLSTSTLAFRVNSLPAPLQEHLSQWVNGRWGRPQIGRQIPRPDRLSRFTDPEDRWLHSVLFLDFFPNSLLQARLVAPDVADYHKPILRTSAVPPNDPRRELVLLGYREGTQQYLDAAHAEYQQWERTHWGEGSEESRAGVLRLAALSPAPDTTDPRLDRRLDVVGGQGDRTPASQLLNAAAQQCGVQVLANWVPDDQAPSLAPEGETVGCTLREALQKLRERRSGLLSWRFYGDMLIVSDVTYPQFAASELAASTAARWAELLSPGRRCDLEELATVLASMNEFQVAALGDDDRAAHLPLPMIRVYGLLNSPARHRAAEPDGYPLVEADPLPERALLAIAQGERPWVESSDLARAVLRVLPRTLSSGEPGLSFVVEYRFEDGDNDRDVLFTAPLQFVVGDDGRLD